MKTFDYYLLRTLFISILVALIFLLGIDFLVRSSEESGALSDQYTLNILFISLILEIPSRIITFMPASILVGTIMSLGQLSTQNELTIIRTSGISRLRISYAGIFLALILGSALILIGEYIAPISNAKSELIINQAKGQSSPLQYKQGIWLTDHQGEIIHIGNLQKDGSIGNLRFYQQQKNGDILVKEAKNARYQTTYWQLNTPSAFKISPNAIQPVTMDSQWKNTISPATLYSLINIKNSNTIRELITLSHFLEANQLNTNRPQLKLWQRLFLPLSTLTMLLLALPFAYSSKRGGNGYRLVIGILLGVSYYISEGILSNLAILFTWPPLLGALLPICLLGIPPLFVLLRD